MLANWRGKGKWALWHISRTTHGRPTTFVVSFDDGDFESGVEAANLRPLYTRGDLVLARSPPAEV